MAAIRAQLSVAQRAAAVPRNGSEVRQPGARGDGRQDVRASPGGSLFRTLKGGLGTLVDALAPREGVHVRHVDTIEAIGQRVSRARRWRLDGSRSCDRRVPGVVGGGLARGLDARARGAARRDSVQFVADAVADLSTQSEFDGQRAGFGFLVPKRERQRLAACTFVGTKFSYRAPDDRIVLRCFFGGIGDEAMLNGIRRIAGGDRARRTAANSGADGGARVSRDFALAAVDGAVYGGTRGARGGNPGARRPRFPGCIWPATPTTGSASRIVCEPDESAAKSIMSQSV